MAFRDRAVFGVIDRDHEVSQQPRSGGRTKIRRVSYTSKKLRKTFTTSWQYVQFDPEKNNFILIWLQIIRFTVFDRRGLIPI